MKLAGVVIFVVLGLSLATWYFFYVNRLPLTSVETTLVSAFWLAMVLSGRWLWASLHKPKAKESKAVKTKAGEGK